MDRNRHESEDVMKFSVIVPIYNSQATLKRALSSVFAQTYRDFEVVIVDDASTEPCDEIVAQFDARQINYIKMEENKGPGAARQAALNAAQGDYVLFVDADDELYDNFILLMYKKKISDNDNPDVIRTMYREVGQEYIRDFSTAQVYSLYGNAYRRQFLLDNNITIPPYRYCEDAIFNQIVNESNPRTVVVNQVTYLYNVNPNSVCGTTDFKKESLAWLIRGNADVYEHFIQRNESRAKTIPCEFISYAFFYFQGLGDRLTDAETTALYELFREWEVVTGALRLMESDERYYKWFLDNVQEGRRKALWYVPSFIEKISFYEFAEKILQRKWRSM